MLLLVSILRELGVRAEPALVSTVLRRKVLECIPASAIFDHTIVRLQLEGRTYWIDPTRQGQRGAALSRLWIPDYGYALVLDPTAESLSPVRPSPEARSRTTIRRTFVGSRFDEPARLTVETTYAGGTAEALRVHLGEVGREELQKSYLRYYTTIYPEVAVATPLEVTDDDLLNRVRLVERYSIPAFWQEVEGGSGHQADLTAVELREFIRMPLKVRRTMPIGVEHPRHVVCETRVHTPEGWAFEPESVRVDNEAVRFRYRARVEGGSLLLYHEYETLSDSVSATNAQTYVKSLARIQDALAFQATAGASQTGRGVSWQGVLLALGVAGGSLALAVRLYRMRPRKRSRFEEFLADELSSQEAPPDPVGEEAATGATPAETPETAITPSSAPPAETGTAGPAGTVLPTAGPPEVPLRIGGWLYLVAATLFFSPFVHFARALESVTLLDRRIWDVLVHARPSGMHPLTAPLVLFEAVSFIALFVGSVLLVALFLARRRAFTRVWLGVMGLNLLVAVVDAGLAAPNPTITEKLRGEQFSGIQSSAISLVLWGLYLTRSRRARQTFIR